MTRETLHQSWEAARIYRGDPWALKHAELQARLGELGARHPGLFTLLEEGRSGEGRAIPLLKLGSGPLRILLWSQMHGDEPTATVALLDLLSHLGRTSGSAATEALLSRLTLYLIPMLNPDGAERNERRNAQGIDVNRDALRLVSPEGRFLKSVRDRYQPKLGFNLHNQSGLVLAGPGGEQVALSVMSVPFDEAGTETDGRRTTKRLAVKVQELVAPWAAGRVARYDMEYTARAFGDSMTRWGTPTLLLETGGWTGPDEDVALVRLNFIALLGALQSLADGSLAEVDPAAYERLPVNSRDRLADLVLRRATLLNGRGIPPFVGDVGFVRESRFAGSEPRRHRTVVVDVGDMDYAKGKQDVDASAYVVTPAPAGGVASWPAVAAELSRQGLASANGELTIDLEALSREVKAWAGGAVLRPGYAGDLLLFARTPGGLRPVKAVTGGELKDL